MEEMEHSLERDKPETEITDSTIPNLETIHLAESASPKKSQHADDIALTQCILCMVLVLSVFALAETGLAGIFPGAVHCQTGCAACGVAG